jgi:hypothetical protein
MHTHAHLLCGRQAVAPVMRIERSHLTLFRAEIHSFTAPTEFQCLSDRETTLLAERDASRGCEVAVLLPHVLQQGPHDCLLCRAGKREKEGERDMRERERKKEREWKQEKKKSVRESAQNEEHRGQHRGQAERALARSPSTGSCCAEAIPPQRFGMLGR